MTCPQILSDGRCATSRKPAAECRIHGRRRSRTTRTVQQARKQTEDAAEASWWLKNRCIHRGDQIGSTGCSSCRTTIPAFSCELHGKCTELRRATNTAFRWCGGCGNHLPRTDSTPDVQIVRGTYPVAIIITCHNYGRFLAECVESALLTGPAEILIVDDASEDDTPTVAAQFADRGVRYMRVENRSAYRSRRDGLALTSARFVVWLDADDLLPPDYLSRGVPLLSDPTVGIVYSDMQRFGLSSQRWTMPEPEQIDLSVQNHCHAGSIVRRAALELADLPGDVARSTHEDQTVWRRLTAAGWKLKKSPAVYQYRDHGGGLFREKEQHAYAVKLGLEQETLTLFVALSGRAWAWPRFRDWLEAQTWPRDQTRLILCDTSQDARFHTLLRRWASQSKYPDVRLYQQDVAVPGVADADRHDITVRRAVQTAVGRIYRRAAQEIRTDFALIVEDDIIPPVDAARRLINSMEMRVASVSGVYRSRFQPSVVAWKKWGHPLPTSSGVETITGNGFGCVLLRSRLLRDVGISTDGIPDYDGNFYAELDKTQWQARLDWSVQCEHLDCHDAGPIRFVVLAQPRTGSTLLCESLGTHPDIRMRTEILNAGHGWNLPQDGRQRLRAAWQHKEPCQAAGFKLLAYQPWDYDPAEWATAWDELADDPFVKVIVLRRNDTRAQFASWKVANTLGLWKDQPQVDRPVIDVSDDELRWFRQWSDQLLAERLRRLDQHERLDVEYETLCDDWAADMDRIQRFIGVATHRLQQATRKSENRPLSDVIDTHGEHGSADGA